MDVLVNALDEPDGFLRFKVIVAIQRLRRDHGELTFARGPVEALLLTETQRYYGYLTLRDPIAKSERQGRPPLLVRALYDKLERTLDRIYRLLALLYPWKDIAAARYTIRHGDGRTRAGAIEYMDNLLSGTVRKTVMPIIEDSPVDEKLRRAYAILKTGPLSRERAVAVLVQDEDQIIAAAAIHFVERHQLWSLAGDLERSLAERPAVDWYVFEAASWSLAANRLSPRKRQELWADELPVVELADRLRAIPLFDFVSIDELFRITAASRQVRHEEGREIYRAGTHAGEVQFVLQGTVQFIKGATSFERAAPAVLGFEHTLDGRPLDHSIRAVDRTIGLALSGHELLTMMSDNILLAQGLFRMLLDAPSADQWRTVYTPPPRPEPVSPRTPLQPLDKVLLLRQTPLFAGGTINQLLDLGTIAREVALTAGSVLFTESDAPALYFVISGEVLLSGNGCEPVVAGAGSTIGISETLAGVPVGLNGNITHDGAALRLEREELFDVLADDVDLLQGVFNVLLQADGAFTRSTEREPSAARQ
jgi:CRP-like cAMP-binding protein